jgi:hypothetical protein
MIFDLAVYPFNDASLAGSSLLTLTISMKAILPDEPFPIEENDFSKTYPG